MKDYSGNIVWNNEEEVLRDVRDRRSELGKIIDPAAAAVTLSMLRGVLEEGGTGYYSKKTGISISRSQVKQAPAPIMSMPGLSDTPQIWSQRSG